MLVHYLIGSKAGQEVDMHPEAAKNALLAGFARVIPGRTEVPAPLAEQLRAAEREREEPPATRPAKAAEAEAAGDAQGEPQAGRTPSVDALLAAAGAEADDGEAEADDSEVADFDSIPAAG